MSSQYFNFSEDISQVPDASDMRVGFIVSEWNNNITNKLLASAVKTLKECGMKENNITVKYVPGSFELIYGASQLTMNDYDAVIAIGCVIRGDTPHFDYICEGTTAGLARLNAEQDVPVIYGLITTNNMEQALDRCGGKHGNKGDECAVTAIKMVDFRRKVVG
jgi:6,7-dimethyl-8-ribityllumazine synthase